MDMPDTPEKSGNRRPEKDRRVHARQRVHSLSYVKMGDDNGGIVLNISESGISVQAAAVLEAGETMPIWLEIPKMRDRLEVAAEIVWLSASRKEAGLRFVDLPESALKQIRQWMAREASPEKFEDESDPVNDEEIAPVQTERRDEEEVRELAEDNVLSAEEMRTFESGHNAAEPLAAAETAEDEGEADRQDEIETEHQTEKEPETELALDGRSEAEAGKELEREVEIQGEAKSADEPAAEDDVEGEETPETEDETETEDELIQAFGPPVVPFERRPHTPFSSMSAISGGFRSSQSLAIAPPLPREVREPLPEPVVPAVAVAGSGWKDFRVQLQTGWFLAALVLLLALISFIAGMAVRRGALNDVLGEQQDALVPRSPATSAASSRSAAPIGGSAASSVNAAPAKPLSIEIVDTSNRRWVIPASTGTNRTSVAGVETEGNSAASPGANHTTIDAGSPAQRSSPPAAVESTSGSASAAKADVPLVLSLPETPISASGSVAISSQRSVPMPANGAHATQNGRNLLVGQLINMVEPVYPADAVQQKIEGTVKLHAVIGTDGVIESLAQISGPQTLVNASMTAVRNWKYSPTRLNGQAIETQEDISFVFRLPN